MMEMMINLFFSNILSLFQINCIMVNIPSFKTRKEFYNFSYNLSIDYDLLKSHLEEVKNCQLQEGDLSVGNVTIAYGRAKSKLDLTPEQYGDLVDSYIEGIEVKLNEYCKTFKILDEIALTLEF